MGSTAAWLRVLRNHRRRIARRWLPEAGSKATNFDRCMLHGRGGELVPPNAQLLRRLGTTGQQGTGSEQ